MQQQNVNSIKFPKVVDVHNWNLKRKGYKDFEDWKNSGKHLYIGRDMHQHIKGAYKSKYQNPYKVNLYGLEECLRRYYEEHKNDDLQELLDYDEIGCWCHDNDKVPNSLEECQCHGDVLLFILKQNMNKSD